MISYRNKKFLHKPLVRAISASLIAVAILGLGGCGTLDPVSNPKPGYLKTDLDYGPPEFRAGYADGCKTALSAYGNTMMKTAYAGIHKTAAYQYNDMYNQVWRDAWNYCYMSYFVFIRPDILYGDMGL